MSIDRFRNEGYTVAPVFDPALVAAAEQDIAAHIDRIAHALYRPIADTFPGEPLARRLDRIHRMDRSLADLLRIAVCTDAQHGPHMQELVRSPELVRTAERLAGVPIDGKVVRVRAAIESFERKLHRWHSDVALLDGSDCGRVRITAWIPLRSVTPSTGALDVAPGRREQPLPHHRTDGFAIDACDLAGAEVASPSCPAGSALFLDRFTPHRSRPLRGPARFALVVWMKSSERPID
ncbi:hypothetical protein B2G71_04920 [Novosphingobium sp. PC22D]|uniref:phytanoyl-CoA dioxygenase family protein n=1 Tax=Novosphingobium sp. PC22D TaxID=1962403 RepID=UPI000BF08358|nr:phytanoyl-CoA dioxygenase family protein [Novosphingobium sp. PC22D]PEQ13668.1 hypothetical protein B2G71_04920 [Novosphingobium sp. PC22D]